MGRRLHTVQEQRDRRRRLQTWGLTAGLIVLLVNAIIGENGYLATLRASRDVEVLSTRVNRVRLENQRIREEGRRLEHDPAALEEAARDRLNLLKPDETLVIIKDVPSPSASTGSR